MEREPGLRGERARKPPLSVAGVGASPQVRGRSGGGAGGEKGLAFSLSLFFQFAALRSCLVAAAFQIEIDSSEQGGSPKGAALWWWLFTCGALLGVLLFLSWYLGELFPKPALLRFGPSVPAAKRTALI